MSPTTNGTGAPSTGAAETKTTVNRVNPVVFGGSLVGVLAVALWAMLARGQAETVIGDAVAAVSAGFGWYYIALATLCVVFVLVVALSRYGNVRLGPDHVTPEFSTFSWAAMLFAAGIGTDLMFFSVAEPVSQFLEPPTGKGGTVEAANDAIVWTLFHYGISGWAMYSVMGMALAYFAYRRHQPLAVRSALTPLLGRHLDGPIGHAVDIAAMLGTIFGVATSLGIGVVSLSVGLDMLFGTGTSLGTQIALVVVAVVMAAVSATTGVAKGIRILSQLNVLLAIGIAAWVLVAGRTTFLLNALVQNIGRFVATFPELTGQTFAYDQRAEWMSLWTLFFWAWWIAWASFVGMFLARISQGRTIRQFVAGTMILPFSYIVMWVSIFGNSAIDRIRSGDTAFGELASATPERGFYTLLQQYPGSGILIALATFVGLLFYVTSADSGALVMANLSSRISDPHEDAAPWLRIVWAATTGLLTIAMLMVGGIVTLQYATVIMGAPFAVVMILVMVSLSRALQVEAHLADGRRRPTLPPMSGPDGAGAGEWKARLERLLEASDPEAARRYLVRVVRPALVAVGEELTQQGVGATVTTEGGDLPDSVELRADDGPHPFVYAVHVEAAQAPAYGGRMVYGKDVIGRLHVHLAAGGQGYDVMGYSRAQLIHDVLDQYEDHLEFLRLEDNATTGLTAGG
ncbi:choline BCCT transporter BetT [Mobilicoccus pelagius]|uniref:Choline transporter n=1 Tax=Mobilicoccus pelagius NBRC 104925 TaxID=1089455 RepID=H5UTT6_9MICO|nr:choline BCCT transporter BetT [Mobilicoccus pelagius]GAB49144.1 choline transporter [Mobilicoccus pelagius NBRC 104925]